MKRFFFICVALIAFAATNASGTGWQQTDQLQTHYQTNHPIVLMPALKTVEYVVTAPAVIVQRPTILFDAGLKIKTSWLIAYSDPDYGLNSFNGCVSTVNRKIKDNDIGNYTYSKLPQQFVQLE